MKTKWMEFKKARKFVNKLKLNNLKDWQKFIKGKSLLLKIPSHPDEIYKSYWKGYWDWLGNGVKSHCYRKYHVNENFFKKWSRDMAYVLGLWFADGSVVKTKSGGNVFDITLHKDDKYLLEKILKIMKSDYPVRKNRNCCFIHINSRTILEDIIKLGGKYRKSLDCKMPHVPKKYLSDFIRGEFDGDGCICFLTCQNRYGTSFVSGSFNFIKKLHDVLKKEIVGLNGSVSIQKSKYKKHNTHSLNFGSYDTNRLNFFMYQNNPKLKMIRKWELFKKAGRIKLLFKDKSKPFLPYEKARKFVNKLKIKNCKGWKKYCSSGKKPNNIPSTPDVIYKGDWESYTQWFGMNKRFVN